MVFIAAHLICVIFCSGTIQHPIPDDECSNRRIQPSTSANSGWLNFSRVGGIGKFRIQNVFLKMSHRNLTYTPPKFNMEPENKSLEKERPFGNHDFQVPC